MLKLSKYVFMKPFILLVMFFLLGAVIPSLSGADHVIEFPTVEPSDILIGTPANVKATIQVGAEFGLIAQSVNLLRLDEDGRTIAILGSMKDDGVAPDDLQGDNIYSIQVEFNEPIVGQIRLMVSAAYRGEFRRTFSEIFSVNVLENISEQEFQSMLAIQGLAYQYFDEQRKLVRKRKRAAQNTVKWLNNQEEVQHAELTDSGQGIHIEYKSGLKGGIIVGPPDTLGGSNLLCSVTSMIQNLHTAGAPDYIESNAAIIMDPFNLANAQWIEAKLEESCVNVAFRGGSQVTVDFLKNIEGYGVIFINTHGVDTGPLLNGICLLTGEEIGEWWKHRWDILAQRLSVWTQDGKEYYAIKPSFIEHYADRQYPKSLVFAAACESLKNDSMANAFIGKGAGAYFGFDKSTYITFAGRMWQELFIHMIDNEETAEQAYNNIPDKRDPNGPDGPVSFIWRGNGDIALPKELVENGSFETANFSGWVKGFTEGGDFPHYACPGSPDYSVVVSEEAVEGNFAARVGKWTQVYTGGLHGPPMPGEEPAGINWIYQDVELPAAPAKTLTFWWRLKEYDTALWSWFDMFVKDPNTDSNLATVVSRAGKPGVDFGVFWDSDWQYVSYDLSAFAGQTVRLWFGNRQDGYGDQCTTYVDDVSILWDSPVASLASTPVASQTTIIPYGKTPAEFKLELAGIAAAPRRALEEPEETIVYQNVPNPFNPDTWIPYQLAENANVTIRLYNVAGKLIRTLNLGHKAKGFYIDKSKAAYWDGRNEAGEHVSSGVYFCSIHAGNFTATRKMLMIK